VREREVDFKPGKGREVEAFRTFILRLRKNTCRTIMPER